MFLFIEENKLYNLNLVLEETTTSLRKYRLGFEKIRENNEESFKSRSDDDEVIWRGDDGLY